MGMLVVVQGLVERLEELKAEDEVDYQMALRALTILSLLRNSWQSWYDVMAFDVMMEHILHRIFNDALRERIKAIYLEEVGNISRCCMSFNSDGYQVVHDMMKMSCCPLCGK